MAPLLGPADSFNSSSATIRPDRPEGERRQTRSSALGPADSVGREFEALISGRAGLLQSNDAVGDADQLSRYLNDYSRMASDDAPTINPASAGLTRLPSEFNPMSFLTDPATGDSDFFSAVPLDNSLQMPNDTPAGIPDFRPGSAQSHRSHHSNYSYSSTEVTDSGFVTTDMDTDDPEVYGVSPSPVADIGALNLGTPGWYDGRSPPLPQTISPSADALGSASHALSSGSRRRKSHVAGFEEDDEESRRVARLEHRRSINRRSAQKHRLRRKEELEDLTKQVAERDAKIKHLEQELAVTRAKLNQLYELMTKKGKAPQ